MRRYFLVFLVLMATEVAATANSHIRKSPVEVLTVGSFHFNFPNLDVQKTDSQNQIDVLSEPAQHQIQQIVKQLKAFAPTDIVVEFPYRRQSALTAQFGKYKDTEKFIDTRRSEVYQLGFRLAKALGHDQVYAADAWGNMYDEVTRLLNDKSEEEAFGRFYQNNPDKHLRYTDKPVFKTDCIAAELLRLNTEENIQKTLGNYLIGPFSYETESSPYFGADFETGRWFNRNLRIFRNIQRIPAAPKARILVIFGSGHMNLLNLFFDASPQYHRVPLSDYLSVKDH